MKQVFMGGSTASAVLRKFWLQGHTTASLGTGERQGVIAEAGTFAKLKVEISTAPGVGESRTYALELNGAVSALTVTISGTDTSASDTTNSVAIAAGDRVALVQNAESAGPAAVTWVRWSLVFEASTATRAVDCGGTSFSSSNASAEYLSIGSYSVAATTADASASIPWGLSGTIRSIYVDLTVAPGAGVTRTFTLYKNGVSVPASAFTIADAATTGNITGLSISVAPGDLFSLEYVATGGAPAATRFRYGVGYSPTTDGQWNVSGIMGGADYTDGQFLPVPGGNIVDSATEAPRTVLADTVDTDMDLWTLNNLWFETATAPGGTDTRTLTVRKSGVDTALTVTITGANTSNSVSALITIAANDTLTIRANKDAGTDASTRFKWTFAASLVATGSLTVSGTVEPTATEQEVRDGGQTIVLTLTGLTWEATMGDCNEITERLIDNLVSAQDEPFGWNNIVRGGISYEDAVLADTPLAFWRLGDTSDTSGNSLTISSVGAGVTQDVDGLLTRSYNEAMLFDGINAGLTISDTASLRNIFDGGGAAEAIVRAASDGESDNGRIVSKGNHWALYVSNQAGGLVKLNFRQEFSGTAGNWQTTDAAIALGARTHIVVTYDADSASNSPTFYINGYVYTVGNGRITETQAPSGTRSTDLGQDVYIGGFGADVLRFRGVIDEVALYGSTLSQTRVLAHLASASNPFGLTCDDVVRTSDTVVTITMPAFPIYDITANETITVTAPNETTSSASDVTGTPTFQIITDGVRTNPYNPPTGGGGNGQGGGAVPDPGGGGDPNNPGGGTEPPPFGGDNGGLGPPAPGINNDPTPEDWEFGLGGLDIGLNVATQRRGRLLRIEVAEIAPTAE